MARAVFLGSLSALTDLVELERQALNLTFRSRGIPIAWTKADYRALIRTKGRFSGVGDVIDGLDGVNQDDFVAELEWNFRDIIDGTRLTPHPWVRDALDRLRNCQLKVALVSGAERQTVLRVLAALYPHRASRVFDLVTSQDMARAAKPAPDLYWASLTALGHAPSDVLAIEATADGVLAAQAAGVPVASFGKDAQRPGVPRVRTANDLGHLVNCQGDLHGSKAAHIQAV